MTLFEDSFTETDLIAFHLQELSLSRERKLRRAIESSAKLAAESAAVAALLQGFKQIPAVDVSHSVLSRNWGAVRPILKGHASPVPSGQGWKVPLWIAAGAAALVTIGFFVGTTYFAAPELSSSAEKRDEVIRREAVPPAVFSGADAAHGYTTRSLDAGGPARHLGGLGRSRTSLLPLATNVESAVRPLSLATTSVMPPPDLSTRPLVETRIIPSPETPLSTSLVPGISTLPDSTRQAKQTRSATKPGKDHSSDFLLAAGGNFTVKQTSTTTSGTSTVSRAQGATNAITAMAAFHQQFRPALGYRVTMSYSRPDFNYSYLAMNNGGGASSAVEINTRVYEIAGTYVAQGPRLRRASTSVDVGAGFLAFLPDNSFQSTSHVYRPAGVAGVSVDYGITKHWGLRAGYRAQVFKAPDFRYTGGSVAVTSRTTVSNEPFAGVTYNFGAAKRR